MSGWIPGWIKGSGASSEEQQATSAPATAPAAESPAEIREKRLRKLEATSAAAAAAAATSAEVAAPARPLSARPVASVSAPAAGTSPAAARPMTAVPRSPLAAQSHPSHLSQSQPPHPVQVQVQVQVTPPTSPASVAARKSAGPVSPLGASLAATSLTPPRVGIFPIAGPVYAALRSPLPPTLLLACSIGLPAEALVRAWENAALTEIFSVRVTDSQQSKLAHRTLLAGLAEELAGAGAASDNGDTFVEDPLLVHRGHLDTLVMERLSQFQELPPPMPESTSSHSHPSSHSQTGGSLTWMIASYRRALALDEKLQAGLVAATSSGAASSTVFPSSASEWQACLEAVTVARTCMIRYVGLLLSDDELFQSGAHRMAARAEFMKLMCSDPNVSRTLPAGMFDSLVQTYQSEEETFGLIFQPFANQLATPLKFAPSRSQLGEVMPLMEDAARALQGLLLLFKHASTAKLVVQHASWLPRVPSGRMLMTVSTLGPLLSLCTASTEECFQQVLNNRPQGEVEADVARLRTSFASYQAQCAQLFRNGIKHAPVREALLLWLAVLVTSNATRRHMQFHPLMVSSDGVFYNVMHVALKLTQPITKKDSRADFEKVNLHYLLQTTTTPGGGRIDYDAITRVQATLADVKAMRAGLEKPILFTPGVAPYSPFNFVTEIFFTTHEILHAGLASIIRQYTELMQAIGRDSRQLQGMDPQALMYPQLAGQLDQMFAMNLATRVHLQDYALTTDVVAFYDWTARWIRFQQGESEQATATPAATAAVEAPASDATPAATAPAATTAAAASSSTPPRPLTLSSLIPETIVEDIVAFFVYLGRFQPQQLLQLPVASYSGVLDLCVSLMAGPSALKNPHLRASLVELLVMLLPADNQATQDHIFATHPALVAGLVPALLDLYVSVEDGRAMYYAKYTCRNQISLLVEFLWQLPAHKAKLVEVETSGGPLFTRFINMLANDLIFLLDEGLKQLSTIREVQVEMADDQTWHAQTSEARTERERSFQQSEQGATSCLTLANATVHMLHYLTAEIITPFVAPEFVERMAHMLDYYISQLVGPKISELKVQNREKYAFKPRELLLEIIGIWLHLAHDKTFLEKVAQDERSYRPGLFSKAARIMRHRAIMPARSILRFEQLNAEVAELGESLLALDEILGDIPDEFSDALMGTLMQDPVQLPQSKQFVDRANIKRQLMNKKVDPFSNTLLTEDMLIEQVELRAQILAWIEERKQVWRDAKKAEMAKEAGDGVLEDDDEASPTAAPSSSTSASATSPAAAPIPAAASTARSYLDDDE